MIGGWVRSQRDRFDHALFRRDKFCRGYAWDWMVSAAFIEEIQLDIQGQTITLNRGQFCHSLRFMAARFRWSEPTVRRFITRLKTDAMIETKVDAGQTVITICNFSKFQDVENKPTQDVTQDVTQERRRSDAKKDKGNVKEDSIDQNFDEFWNLYPRKKSPGLARRAFKTAMKKVSFEDLMSGLESYVATIRANGTEERFIKHPSSWLNGECWADQSAPSPQDTLKGFEHLVTGKGR